MYYLLQPDASVYWNDFPEFTIDRLERDHGIDWTKFPWEPAERRFDAGTLNIALRYGRAVPRGILVGGQALVELDHYRNMIEIVERNEQRDSTNVPHSALMEAVLPGWNDETRERDERIRESMRAQLRQAEADVRESFAKPVDPSLAEHWQSLGGGLPPQPAA